MPPPLPPPWICEALGQDCEVVKLDQPSYISATLTLPRLEDFARLPSIVTSSVEKLGGHRAQLTLEGHDLGYNIRDVLSVRVGTTECEVTGIIQGRSVAYPYSNPNPYPNPNPNPNTNSNPKPNPNPNPNPHLNSGMCIQVYYLLFT